nr:hypothetical protein [Morganella morganii]
MADYYYLGMHFAAAGKSGDGIYSAALLSVSVAIVRPVAVSALPAVRRFYCVLV